MQLNSGYVSEAKIRVAAATPLDTKARKRMDEEERVVQTEQADQESEGEGTPKKRTRKKREVFTPLKTEGEPTDGKSLHRRLVETNAEEKTLEFCEKAVKTGKLNLEDLKRLKTQKQKTKFFKKTIIELAKNMGYKIAQTSFLKQLPVFLKTYNPTQDDDETS